MWIPLIESERLKERPVRRNYWGTPVVLFRTRTGRVGALEDRCAHRAVALSSGRVLGESIECGYHGFRFARDGQCTRIPSCFPVDDDFRASCTVPHLEVREAAGWVFATMDPELPFPDVLEGPEEYVTYGGEHAVDPLLYLDHLVDVEHTLFVHARSLNLGARGEAAVTDIQVSEAGSVRVRGQIEVRRQMPLPLCLHHAGSVPALLRGLLGGADRGQRLTLERRMHSPASWELEQQAESGFGARRARLFTFVNPLDGRRCELRHFFHLAPTARPSLTARLERRLLPYLLARSPFDHEDVAQLGAGTHDVTKPLHLTDSDHGLVAVRAALVRYVRARAHRYPADSVLHDVARRAAAALPAELQPSPVRAEA